MLRNEFAGIFIGFIVKKISSWLPEEDTEEEMLNIMQKRLAEHNSVIRKILVRNEFFNNVE